MQSMTDAVLPTRPSLNLRIVTLLLSYSYFLKSLFAEPVE